MTVTLTFKSGFIFTHVCINLPAAAVCGGDVHCWMITLCKFCDVLMFRTTDTQCLGVCCNLLTLAHGQCIVKCLPFDKWLGDLWSAYTFLTVSGGGLSRLSCLTETVAYFGVTANVLGHGLIKWLFGADKHCTSKMILQSGVIKLFSCHVQSCSISLSWK